MTEHSGENFGGSNRSGFQVRGFRIPLVAPFRGATAREGVLIQGPEGWGEYSPFPGYSDGYERLCRQSAIRAAFDSWPAPLRDRIPVHATVPALCPDKAFEFVKSSGCSSAKVKVAEGDDEGRIEAVRDALGPRGKISLDANGAWELDFARTQINRLSRFDIEFVEQPVATLEAMEMLRRRVNVPLAADEIARTPEDAVKIAHSQAADLIVVKVQNMGGVWEALRAIEACGLPAVVASLIETSVGISAGVALAAALPELPFACGLGTIGLLAGDVTSTSIRPSRGYVSVNRPAVDFDVLADCELAPQQVRGWAAEGAVADA